MLKRFFSRTIGLFLGIGKAVGRGIVWAVRHSRWPLWLAVVVAGTWWVWHVSEWAFAAGWITLSPVKIGQSLTIPPLRIPPLPFYPTALFAIFALLVRPPFILRTGEYWVLDTRWVPRRERRKGKILGRLIFFRIGLFKNPPSSFSVRRFLRLLVLGCVVALTAALPTIKEMHLEDVKRDFSAVLSYEPTVSTRVYASGGEEICRFMLEDRVYVSIDRVPTHVRQAFVAAEDKNYFTHRGIDPVAILRAARENREHGHIKQGGSTISQQVVKQVLLKTNERSFVRKFRELFLVVELERKASKDKILEVYLNHIFLGHAAYGIQAAAQAYFGKDVDELSLAEASLLAGLPKAPSSDSPFAHYDRAKGRQAYVLSRMVECGFISEQQKEAAMHEEVQIVDSGDPLNRTAAPYFCEHARRELQRMFGANTVFRKGLLVQSTIDLNMQRAAEAAVRNGLLDLERRLGFSGPEGHDAAYNGECPATGEEAPDTLVDLAKVAKLDRKGPTVCLRGSLFPVHPDDARRIASWEKKLNKKLSVGDILSVRIQTVEERVNWKKTRTMRYALVAKRTGGESHKEALQAAMVAIEPTTGTLKALVGGYDFNENQYNCATQAHRQTGSSVKPYVYLSALRGGTLVTDIIVDRPTCYDTASGKWCPRNYEDKFLGAVDLRTALSKSLNSVSVQLAAKVGVDAVIKTMRDLGITSKIERVLPISVGALDITLWEHAFAYSVIAAGGQEPPRHPGATEAGVFFTKITDIEGNALYEYVPGPRRQVVPASDAYALAWLMKGVVEDGTARRARELRRPAAGKTGTTNNNNDAWFMGFTADLFAGVWVGRLTPKPIGPKAVGGAVALPIWLAFMKAAHPATPPREFPVPSDIVLMRRESGDLVPLQRGRVPAERMTRDPRDDFSDLEGSF